MQAKLADLAKICGARLEGDADCEISAVNTLSKAKHGEISFLSNRHYAHQLNNTNASAVILAEEDLKNSPTNALVTATPYLAYAKIANHLYPRVKYSGNIDGNVIKGADCKIDETSFISANVVIGNNVSVGSGTYIGPACVIGDDVEIGENSTLHANVILQQDVVIGNNVTLHPGVVIGADGFGMAQENEQWVNIPQIGSVRVGNNVDVGANSTIDRGAIEDTVIADGVKIDNQVQIGHNVIIGEHTAIAGCTGIAGSTVIGKRCMIAGAVAISGHIQIVDDVIITGMSGVANSIKSPGIYSSGLPVTENKIWRRNIIRFKKLDEILKKLTT
ncbi:MAG: UDP-3-O-(3-hydroxymyristoyl)glucosamine N-acyltransferase [Proteobacteria bacterium]|nr:UDP-3-O-(3-hydroxymyristoyl)glucosamine N-acyltransferase [Pseudomonadota bacterium]NOG60823.1 UDP-3-O-(3-hydroxymyristoyl)glucosamine N-acyltransferase [Pseudomonadota bacterium]